MSDSKFNFICAPAEVVEISNNFKCIEYKNYSISNRQFAMAVTTL